MQFHSINDGFDVDRLPTVYSKNACMRFGNGPQLEGLDAVQSYFASAWSNIESMHHEIDEIGEMPLTTCVSNTY
jgi:hypothetical protein